MSEIMIPLEKRELVVLTSRDTQQRSREGVGSSPAPTPGRKKYSLESNTTVVAKYMHA